jgi:hypothetical protein
LVRNCFSISGKSDSVKEAIIIVFFVRCYCKIRRRTSLLTLAVRTGILTPNKPDLFKKAY